MKGVQMKQKYVLNESFKALVESIFGKQDGKSEKLVKAFEELVNDRATTISLNLEVLKQEMLEEARKELVSKDTLELEVEKLKNQLATKADIKELLSPLASKEFVRSEIAKANADLLKWLVGTQIAVGGFVVALLKFFQ